MTRTAPAIGSAPRITPPQVLRHQLSNGLELLVATRRHMPVVDWELVIRGGAVLDQGALAGTASMVAEMLDEGAAGRSALEISSAIEQLGAELDLRTNWDATLLHLHSLTTRMPAALDLFAAVALQPDFPDDELERKRTERLNSLAQERDEPRLVAHKTLALALFGETHPYGQPIGGTEASIAALSRGDLLARYRRIAGPQGAHLVVAGAIEFEEAVAQAERLFGDWRSDANATVEFSGPHAKERTIYLVDKPGAAQSEIRVGHQAPPRSTPDYFALLVLNTILGGSFKSRLNMTLREEKGYTYGAGTGFAFRRHGGMFSGGAAVFTDVTADAVRLTFEEIATIRDEGVTADELERARNYIALGFARNFEAAADIAAYLADVALHDLPDDYLARYPDEIEAVTLEQVNAAAQNHLDPEHLAIVVVGDRERITPGLQDLDLAPIQYRDAR